MSTTTLKLTFYDASGKTKTISLSNAKAAPTEAQATTLMDAMITNGSVFANAPVTKRKAQVVTTTTTAIDIGS